MIGNQKPVAASSRLRPLLCVFLLIAAGIAIVAAIGSARDLNQARLPLSEQTDRQSARRSADGPTPTPFPCPPCWKQLGFSANFDAVLPPGLPQGWRATNALGPPPLWVTSNSGVPMPPADTSPNAAYIDDPPVVSDKR